MFRSPMRSSSGSFSFISLLMLLILKYFNISNINKEINEKLPEDDLIEDRNKLECFVKCFKCF